MYDMNDLFNSRDVVGCKLNQIIGSHKYTKSNVCTGAGISRPTLDKLLNGEVTNKTNFEKHISKLLAFLSLTPSELMGGIANPFTDSKTLRDALHLDLQQLSQRCGLSIDELQKIEYFQTGFGTNANVTRAKQALKSIKGLETRKYKPE